MLTERPSRNSHQSRVQTLGIQCDCVSILLKVERATALTHHCTCIIPLSVRSIRGWDLTRSAEFVRLNRRGREFGWEVEHRAGQRSLSARTRFVCTRDILPQRRFINCYHSLSRGPAGPPPMLSLLPDSTKYYFCITYIVIE